MPPAGTRSASSDPGDRSVPDALRPRLAARYGEVLTGAAFEARVRALAMFATCGDRVTADVVRLGRLPLIGIVDGRTQRNEPIDLAVFGPLRARAVRHVRNPPGLLTAALRATVAELARGVGGLIEVDGEEDLGSLALVESLPAGATVIYGIPGAGASFVTVDAAAKERVRALIDAMDPR